MLRGLGSNQLFDLSTGYPTFRIEPREFRLVLIFDNRKTLVEKWGDVFSINFLIHMTEIKQRLNSTDIRLHVDFCYSGGELS